jgi:hypothetical protein
MGTKYATIASSGYNSVPPVDDGTVSEANKVKWSTVKTKLADPVKTLADAINTALVTHFDNGPRALTGNTTLGASDYQKFIQVSGSSVTLTLTDAATLGAGWNCHIFSTDSSNSTTIALATVTDTINGVAANFTLPARMGIKVEVNAAATGFEIQGYLNVLGNNTITSTDAGAASGPKIILDRNSASPAASDDIGAISFLGRDSGGNSTEYAAVTSTITDPTNGSEDSNLKLWTYVAGTEAARITVAQGVQVGSPTGGDKGSGTINATAVYDDNVLLGSAASGASLVLISSAAGNNVASVSFTSGIDSSYAYYLIAIQNAIPATDAAILGFTVSIDSGANYATADYQSRVNSFDSGGTDRSVGSSSASTVDLTSSVSNTTNQAGASILLYIVNPAGTAQKQFMWTGAYEHSTSDLITTINAAAVSAQTAPINTVANAVNAIKFAFSSGNIASGNFYLYGVRSS